MLSSHSMLKGIYPIPKPMPDRKAGAKVELDFMGFRVANLSCVEKPSSVDDYKRLARKCVRHIIPNIKTGDPSAAIMMFRTGDEKAYLVKCASCHADRYIKIDGIKDIMIGRSTGLCRSCTKKNHFYT